MALEAVSIATWVLDVENDRVYGDFNLRRFFDVALEPMNGGALQPYLDAIHSDDRQLVGAILKGRPQGQRQV